MKTVKPPGKAWRTWPTKAEVMRDYSLSAAQLGALVRHRRLTAYICTDKSTRFAPLELAAVFATEPEEGDEPAELAVPLDPHAAAMGALVRVLTETGTMLKDSREGMVRMMDGVEKLLTGSVKPMERGLAFYEKVMAVQESRIERLEQGWIDGIVAREASMSQQHERELMATVIGNEQAVKKQALDMAFELGPKILSQWKMGKSAEAALDFLLGVDDALLAAAAEMNLAPPDKVAALRELRATVKAERAKAAAAAAKKPPDGGEAPPPNGAMPH